MSEIDFGELPAVVNLYLADGEDHVEYRFERADDKNKLKHMTVKQTVDYVLDKLEDDIDYEDMVFDFQKTVSTNPGYSISIYGDTLSVKKDNGVILADERDTFMSNENFWRKDQDLLDNQFYKTDMTLSSKDPENGKQSLDLIMRTYK